MRWALSDFAKGEFMARFDFKAGALLGPLPAVMVTVSDGERDNVLTVAWCGILSTDPSTCVYIRKTVKTLL